MAPGVARPRPRAIAIESSVRHTNAVQYAELPGSSVVAGYLQGAKAQFQSGSAVGSTCVPALPAVDVDVAEVRRSLIRHSPRAPSAEKNASSAHHGVLPPVAYRPKVASVSPRSRQVEALPPVLQKSALAQPMIALPTKPGRRPPRAPEKEHPMDPAASGTTRWLYKELAGRCGAAILRGDVECLVLQQEAEDCERVQLRRARERELCQGQREKAQRWRRKKDSQENAVRMRRRNARIGEVSMIPEDNCQSSTADNESGEGGNVCSPLSSPSMGSSNCRQSIVSFPSSATAAAVTCGDLSDNEKEDPANSEGRRRNPCRMEKLARKVKEESSKKKRVKARQLEFEEAVHQDERDTIAAAFEKTAGGHGELLESGTLVECLSVLGLGGETEAEREVVRGTCEDFLEGEQVDFFTFAVKVLPRVRKVLHEFLWPSAEEHFRGRLLVLGEDSIKAGRVLPVECVIALDRCLNANELLGDRPGDAEKVLAIAMQQLMRINACSSRKAEVVRSMEGFRAITRRLDTVKGDDSSLGLDSAEFATVAQRTREALMASVHSWSLELRGGGYASAPSSPTSMFGMERNLMNRPCSELSMLHLYFRKACVDQSLQSLSGKQVRTFLMCVGLLPLRWTARMDPMEEILWSCCDTLLRRLETKEERTSFEFSDCLEIVDSIRTAARSNAKERLRQLLLALDGSVDIPERGYAVDAPAGQALSLLRVLPWTRAERQLVNQQLQASTGGGKENLPLDKLACFAAGALERLLRDRRGSDFQVASALGLEGRIGELWQAFGDVAQRECEAQEKVGQRAQQRPSSSTMAPHKGSGNTPQGRGNIHGGLERKFRLLAAGQKHPSQGSSSVVSIEGLRSACLKVNQPVNPKSVQILAAAVAGAPGRGTIGGDHDDEEQDGGHVADTAAIKVDFNGFLLTLWLSAEGYPRTPAPPTTPERAQAASAAAAAEGMAAFGALFGHAALPPSQPSSPRRPGNKAPATPTASASASPSGAAAAAAEAEAPSCLVMKLRRRGKPPEDSLFIRVALVALGASGVLALSLPRAEQLALIYRALELNPSALTGRGVVELDPYQMLDLVRRARAWLVAHR